jgi:UDP-sugar transporter A1/2/3
MSEQPMVFGVPVGYLVLCLLVVQNAGAVLLMRAVRALPGETNFNTQTAVIMQELLKAGLCMLLMLRKNGTLAAAWENRVECLKTTIPALLYLVQNNLQYVAMTYLDAPTYAVTYQTKLLWVAVCSAAFLGKSLERYQWFSLVLLMSGVGLVQLSQTGSGGAQVTSPALRVTGMVILLLAALCSSLAAVSFEKLLKGVKVDLWTRNLQLAFFSIICSIVPLVVTQDGERILDLGFFHGYTWLTWSCIAMNAFGGLLVGAVINYCDAILKDIAIGASIVVSAIGSMYFFDFHPQGGFTVGVALVSYAVPLYAGRANMCDVKEFLSTVFWQRIEALADIGRQLRLLGGDNKDAWIDLEMMKPNVSTVAV